MTPKPDGEKIAAEGDRADRPVDEEVQAHPCDDDPGHLKSRSQYQDDGSDEIGQHVANSGYQSEQRIESQIEWCAWSLDGSI